jgi:selenocysteine-specific elongation factor
LLEEKFKESPTNPYLSKEILRARLQVEKPLMEELIRKLNNQGKIETLEDKIKLKTEEQETFSTKNQALRKQIEKLFLENPFSPPLPEEAKDKFPGQEKEIEQMIYRLINEKVLLKIGPSYFHREAIEKAREIIGKEIKVRGPLTASEIKEILGSTRKYVIPLLEYLDRQRFTRRVGDKRQLFE